MNGLKLAHLDRRLKNMTCLCTNIKPVGNTEKSVESNMKMKVVSHSQGCLDTLSLEQEGSCPKRLLQRIIVLLKRIWTEKTTKLVLRSLVSFLKTLKEIR